MIPAPLAELLASEGLLVDEPGATSAAGLPHESAEGTLERAVATAYRFEPGRTVGLLAGRIRTLQELVLPEPGDPARPRELDVATALAEAEEFTSLEPDAPVDPAYGHMDRSELLEVLRTGAERIGDVSSSEAVISHGRATLYNLWCARGAARGFSRWEGVAIADPHRDVAAAAGSVAAVFGPMMVPEFFGFWQEEPSPVRLDWWLLQQQLTGVGSPGAPKGAAVRDG